MSIRSELTEERVKLQVELTRVETDLKMLKSKRSGLYRAISRLQSMINGEPPDPEPAPKLKPVLPRFPPDDGSNVQYALPASEAVDESIPPFLRRQK